MFIDRQVLIQREDSTGNITVRSQLDLAQRTICVVKDSPTVSRISNLAREIGDSIYTQELDKSQEQLFLLVAAGEVEFAVINDKIAESMAKNHKGVNVNTAVSFNQFQSWVLAKSDTTRLRMVNTWLKDIQSTPEYKTLHQRYF